MKKDYKVVVHHAARKTMSIFAHNREQAIKMASDRAARLGLEVTTLQVPFLEGDDT